MKFSTLCLVAGMVMAGTVAANAQMVRTVTTTVDSSGYCREYQSNIIVGDRMRSGYGTACMQPDGDWEMSNQEAQPVAQVQQVQYVTGPVYRAAPVPVYREVYVEPRPLIDVRLGFGPYPRYYYNDHHRHKHWRGHGYGYGHGHGYDDYRGHGYGHWR